MIDRRIAGRGVGDGWDVLNNAINRYSSYQDNRQRIRSGVNPVPSGTTPQGNLTGSAMKYILIGGGLLVVVMLLK